MAILGIFSFGAAVVGGAIECNAYIQTLLFGDRFSARWPFHKDSVATNFAPHVLVGFLASVLPIYHIITTLEATGPYCVFHECA